MATAEPEVRSTDNLAPTPDVPGPSDPDAAFRAVEEEMVSQFAAPADGAAQSPALADTPPPAPEPEAEPAPSPPEEVAVTPAPAPPVDPTTGLAVVEPFVPGMELAPAPSPEPTEVAATPGDDATPAADAPPAEQEVTATAPPEGAEHGERVSTALRLTGQAVHAWIEVLRDRPSLASADAPLAR